MPFKKIIAVFTSIIVVGLAIFGIYSAIKSQFAPKKEISASAEKILKESSSQKNNKENPPANNNEENNVDPSKDSDSDGLSDELEKKYKTDPFDPDTDDDGYIDGEEIKNGYDPTKPAPNDKLTDKEPASNENQNSDLGQRIKLENFFPPENRLTINETSSEETIKKYFEDSKKIAMPEMKELTDATFQAKKGDTSQLLTVIAKIDRSYQDLLKISAPRETLLIHKETLAEIRILRRMLAELSASDKSDIAFTGFQAHAKELKVFTDQTRVKINELAVKYGVSI